MFGVIRIYFIESVLFSVIFLFISGPIDAVLYRGTLGLCIVGLISNFYNFYKLANPVKK